ncbi:hypothetical protein [Actinomycetospora atypica]|uniref:Cell division protein FtsL n=1 Tax=Actinomycetospora atypica TaxID=1290095 RepID=A0ABV9YLY9_9PSEU
MSSGTLERGTRTAEPTPRRTPAARSTSSTAAGAKARATSRRTPAPSARKARTTALVHAEATGGTAPFVLLIMVLLTSGLVATLWLSTAAAADSYRLDDARQATRDRTEEVERLHRDVAAMQSAPALAAAAQRIGMVPAGVPAVILVRADGTSQVVGTPQKAKAAAPPPAPVPPPAAPANGAPDPEALAADPATGVQAATNGTPAPPPAGAGTTTTAPAAPTNATAGTTNATAGTTNAAAGGR